MRNALAVGLLPILHVVFCFEPGDEATSVWSRVVGCQMAMAGLHEVTPGHFARFMRRLRQSSVYVCCEAYQRNNDDLTFVYAHYSHRVLMSQWVDAVDNTAQKMGCSQLILYPDLWKRNFGARRAVSGQFPGSLVPLECTRAGSDLPFSISCLIIVAIQQLCRQRVIPMT